jgi:hypothetical protein
VLLPERLRCNAFLMDVSAHGTCLCVRSRVETDTVLRLRLSNREQLLRHEVTLRVTHARRLAEGRWIVGGPFGEPLPPIVLHALMR